MTDSPLLRFAPPDTPGLAKYAQFRDLIVRAIRGGHWRPGDRIPTEQELTAALPYSLGTIQRGLRMLVEDGVLTRRAGLGSFVADTSRPMSEPWHLRFEDGRGGVLPLFPKVVAVENPARRGAPGDADLVARLKPSGPVFAIERLIDVGGLFKVHAYFIAEIAHFPRLATRKPSDLLGQNLRLFLSRELGLPILQGRDTFRVRLAEPSASARLKLSAGTAVLELCSVAMAAGMPVYAQRFLIPPNAPPLIARKDGAQ
jgi:DNA-binding GntR family transcriptional regulator